MTAPLPPPGWYPDPSGAQGQRYWDGQTWWGTNQPPPPVVQQRAGLSTGRKWAIVGAVVGGVVLLGVVGNHSERAEEPASSRTTSTSLRATPAAEPTLRPNPTVAPPGSAVRDGKFEFQVLAVASAKTVSDATGNPYLTANAQGVFVIFTLSVRNIGDQPRSYSGVNQKLIDMSGREYQVSSDADLYMNSYGLMDNINPGNAIEVKVPFDVPPDIQMSMLELHDSMFSAGVRVAAAAGP